MRPWHHIVQLTATLAGLSIGGFGAVSAAQRGPAAAPQRTTGAAQRATVAQRPPERPSTPLTGARTAFLINERQTPASRKQFSQLRGRLLRWRRFDLVQTANRADVTISLGPAPSLTVRQRSNGTELWTTTGGTVPVMLQRFEKEFPAAPKVCFIAWCR